MLKALEILKDIQDSKWCGVKPTLVNWKLEDFNEAIAELEEIETKDRLAELEKAILDYYLDKGYQIGVGGWQFSIDINTYYKLKYLNVNFRESSDTFFFRVVKIESKTTKEMFDKAIEYFTIK